ncbi:ABC transporter permease (plasmid) [Deinococcus metallilatus]|uniref:ABC transporter permease n=1 Tax=Deinococcus metallilatus TaxID=1211322 RepID=A0AAJ5F665_9DEIO|nr:ABC transporter permease [Deinococcus metallilatus]MBB5293422.1 peptide/nickel transport system permease protein [Deinococcus metallilatus]QBY06515.1 ABC transporter permease [Deinococcus metallilatus]RXJ17858.1 ABC transporter permease [Deinococcus metallilatus]TLK32130.1 ABC transporter permease [Deinococcus metallilatus]GMA15358.1 peptide ABC transporter permease [Deinococcus metallilatus]
MTRYIANRLVQLLIVLFGVSLLVFIAMRVLPGDVATLLLGERATPEQLTRLRHQIGLDQPLPVQYLRFLGGVLHGDFGTSIKTNTSALGEVLRAFPTTLQLSFAALALAVLVAVPLGVLAARRPYSWLDNLIMALSLVGVSMPIFWLSLMLILVFGGLLGWLPTGGSLPIGAELPRVTGLTILDSLLARRPDLTLASVQHLILPTVALATIPLALITRITRSEMLGVLSNDYVRTARAKGLPERDVIRKHALRNALIPVVTVIGLQLGLLLSGAFLTETIFALPGVGRLMIESILSRDYPVVQAAALVVATIFILVNLLVDLTYGLIDPRIQYQ